MCVLCEANAIQNNDDLTAGVKIARLYELMVRMCGEIDRVQRVCILANKMGIDVLSIHQPALDNLFCNLDEQAVRVTDKILDNEPPPLDPGVLARFYKKG